MAFRWVFAILILFSIMRSAEAAKVRVARSEENKCTIAVPPEGGLAVKGDDHLGATYADLKKLVDSASDPTTKSKYTQLALWYSGAQRAEMLSSKSLNRIVKWDDCDQVHQLAKAMNSETHGMPKMDCAGGKFVYRFLIEDGKFKMRLLEKTSEGMKSHGALPVTLTDTANPRCATRVERTTPNALQFKMCLQVDKAKPQEASGTVGIRLANATLDNDDRTIRCELEERFGRVAKSMITKEEGSGALAAAPAKTAPGRVTR